MQKQWEAKAMHIIFKMQLDVCRINLKYWDTFSLLTTIDLKFGQIIFTTR